jgi:hypothetical protein
MDMISLQLLLLIEGCVGSSCRSKGSGKMPLFDNEGKILAFSSVLLLLLLNAQNVLDQHLRVESDEDVVVFCDSVILLGQDFFIKADGIATIALYNFRIYSILSFWMRI